MTKYQETISELIDKILQALEYNRNEKERVIAVAAVMFDNQLKQVGEIFMNDKRGNKTDKEYASTHAESKCEEFLNTNNIGKKVSMVLTIPPCELGCSNTLKKSKNIKNIYILDNYMDRLSKEYIKPLKEEKNVVLLPGINPKEKDDISKILRMFYEGLSTKTKRKAKGIKNNIK